MKSFLQKLTFQIRLKKLLCLKKFKILRRVNMLLVILTVQKLLETFKQKNRKKQIKKSLELKSKKEKS